MITFARKGVYVNPSRAPPRVVKPSVPSDTQRSTSYTLQANMVPNYQYSVFTSVFAITSSNFNVNDPPSQFRQLSGTMCCQEWERFCAFFCMVYKVDELHAQIYDDAISVSTR